MKITVSRLLDVSTLDAEIQPKIQPLVTQMNTSTEQFARALRGEITLQDNVKSTIKSISQVPHNTLTSVNLNTNSDIEGVVLAQSSQMVTGFYWELGTVKGAINLKIKTDDSTPSNIKLIAFLK